MSKLVLSLSISPFALALASCNYAAAGDSPPQSTVTAQASSAAAGALVEMAEDSPFKAESFATLERPWALAVEPGSGNIFITEREGTLKIYRPATGQLDTVGGLPKVDFGGQGGLGDFAFAPDYQSSRNVYVSWAEAGEDDTRGAVVGRGTLNCDAQGSCKIDGLNVIWRQAPKTTGRGHYSHRIAFSPDGAHLFIASGDRQKMTPAQDPSNTVGSIVRLNLDGSVPADNPLATQDCSCEQIWSYGHRNILGLAFAPDGKLWEVEHGPAGGDELNLVVPGANYGWPTVSDGVHYGGEAIPDHATRPDLEAPKVGWTPVIAPGDMTFVEGKKFKDWQGDLLIAGMSSRALVHIKFDGDTAREHTRHTFENRIRGVAEDLDGALWVIEDGKEARLIKLTPS